MSATDLVRVAEHGSDGALVRRVLGGEREAFSILVSRHQAALFRHARGMGVDRTAAQDLVQDAFMKAYLRLRQCRDPERFRSWLLGLFRNGTLDFLRDVRRREEPLDAVAETHAVAPGAERHDAGDAVAKALAELPDILREAFLLRHQQERSYEEIAEITGASLSAAKMRVMRAREALRRAVEPDAGDATGALERAS